MSTADVSCTRCGTQFQVSTEYFRIFGEDPFCRDCLIHTKCHVCDRGLRLQPSRYQELGGDPLVCKACETDAANASAATSATQAASDTDSSGGSFWSGLSIGEKIVFPILLVAFVGILGLSVAAGLSGGSVEAPILLPILILLYWTYRRGKKNSTGS